MTKFETWLKSDLSRMIQVQPLDGVMFTADNAGNIIGVEVTDNGQPANISGGVTGWAIRADGGTVMIDGTLSGNRASVVMPASAYVVPGPISIVIKVGTMTVGACTGYVYQSTTDEIIDPGRVIPSLAELLAHINDAIQAADNANSAATNANAKASAADAAATRANTAADNANTKASAADTAATNANNKATIAQAAATKIDGMTVAATKLSEGSNPTVAISEVSGHKHIAFGIPKGDKGAKGDPGKDFHIAYTFISVAQMQAYTQAALYDYAMIDTGSVEDPETGRLYCWENDSTWHYIGDLSGAQGIKGETGTGIASIQLNQDYTLTITMDDGNSYTTASIRGAQGPQGNPGQNGSNGANAYVHIRYAAQQPTSDSDIKTTPDEWIGLYSGTSATAPTTYTSYTWYKFKGETGVAENIYGTTVPMSPTDSTKVASAVQAAMTAASEKYTKPATGIPASDIANGVIPGVMTGSTAQAAGTAGLVPAPAAGSQNKALFGDGTWKAVADPSDMTGATSSAAGTHGLVPAPAAGDQDKALFGDGTWKTVSVEDPDDFTGATASTAGAHGLVPAPAAGDQTKVLTGDGTWKVSPGAKVYEKTVTITNVSGAYSQTFVDENISADMKAVELEVNRSYVFGDSIIVTPNDGSVTIACNDVAGTDTIKISLIKVIDDPTAVTSTEFTILNNRLLAVENVCTDTNIVIETTDWELNSGSYEYTWESSIINSACSVEVMLRDGSESSGLEGFEFEKVTGGVKFTADILATGDLPLTVRVVNAKADAFQELTASDIYTEAVAGVDNVEEALTTIVDDVSDNTQAIANKIPGKIVVLTGTTASNGSDLNLSYPTGASYSNTIVLSAQIEAAGAWRIIGSSTPTSDYMLNIRLVSTYIKVETAVANSGGKPLKLVLFITE